VKITITTIQRKGALEVTTLSLSDVSTDTETPGGVWLTAEEALGLRNLLEACSVWRGKLVLAAPEDEQL
jgi:hypothetical protein